MYNDYTLQNEGKESKEARHGLLYHVNLCHWEVYRVEISGGL